MSAGCATSDQRCRNSFNRRFESNRVDALDAIQHAKNWPLNKSGILQKHNNERCESSTG